MRHKGEKKQNVWVNNLRGILAETSNLDSDVRNIVNTILDHENIPRKKPKFVNFVKNIMRNRANSHSIDKTWELFSQALNPPATEEKVEDVKMETVVVKKKKKREDTEETVSYNTNVESKKKSKKDKKSKDKQQNTLEEDNSEKENSENSKSKKKQKKDREEEESVKKIKKKT